MAKLPSVLVLTGDNNEIEKFLKSLVANGLVENTLRNYSSSKIDLSILGELISALQNAQEEVSRLTEENKWLKDDAKKEGALKERIGVLEHSLEEAQDINQRMKDMLSKCYAKNLGIDEDTLRKEIEGLLAEV